VDEQEMIHVFVLLLFIGQGDGKQLVSGDMYFYDIKDCNWYAAQLVKRYGNYKYNHRIPQNLKATAYCEPRYIQKDSLEVY
jgi:hypothetical protein